MSLSGLDIYKLLPKTNCKQCGFPTCLAFAMQLAKKAVSLEKCPFISAEVKARLEEASAPPVKTVFLGPKKLAAGGETVLFRHEEKFRTPCAIGVIVDDSTGAKGAASCVEKIKKIKTERIGQLLELNLVCVKQTAGAGAFAESAKAAAGSAGELALCLMSKDPAGLKSALEVCGGQKPLIFGADASNLDPVCALAKQYSSPLVVSAPDLDSLSALTQECVKRGVSDLILDTGKKNMADKIWDLTQIRRLALKKSVRSLGYPAVTVVENADPYSEALEAGAYILKYSSLALISGANPWEALALMTLRQNIYTDPQKPLQIEPKVYPFGKVTEKSPVLVTTNFSLSFYTVAGEVEASKVPSYIISVDTEGMSVLTAWAAEKFTPEKVADSLKKCGVSEMVSHRRLIIPGYVAVMSGELEEASNWQITVGPKEAAGIPQFLKNLH